MRSSSQSKQNISKSSKRKKRNRDVSMLSVSQNSKYSLDMDIELSKKIWKIESLLIFQK